MKNSIFNQSFINAMTIVVDKLTSIGLLPVIGVITFVVQMMLLGVLCAHIDGVWGWSSEWVILLILLPGIVLILLEVFFVTTFMEQYDQLKKEQDNG